MLNSSFKCCSGSGGFLVDCVFSGSVLEFLNHVNVYLHVQLLVLLRYTHIHQLLFSLALPCLFLIPIIGWVVRVRTLKGLKLMDCFLFFFTVIVDHRASQ